MGIIFCIALTAHGASIRGASGAAAASGATGIPEPTWGPKKVLKTTNYLDVDPQDYAKITVARETAANATQAKNLRNLMLEDRKSDCVGTGRDCNLDNHEQVDQDKTKREEMKSESDKEEARSKGTEEKGTGEEEEEKIIPEAETGGETGGETGAEEDEVEEDEEKEEESAAETAKKIKELPKKMTESDGEEEKILAKAYKESSKLLKESGDSDKDEEEEKKPEVKAEAKAEADDEDEEEATRSASGA